MGQEVDYSKDENEERGNWSGRLDFLLSCIGFAVGLGNVWRFPYLCYKNGGGAFLIPYVIFLTIAGLPLFFMELALGQFSSAGPSLVWRFSPLIKGVGYAMMTISGIVGIYYNVILAYAIFYFFASFVNFQPEVPWKTCNNTWNTDNCFAFGDDADAFGNGTRVSPADEYWNNFVLERSPGIDETGSLNWKMTLALLCAWLIVFLCLIKGIKSTGKVVYFTATFPYLVLTILIIRGALLDGSMDGIKFYMVPKWHRLQDPQVWGDAAVQIFYSLGPAWGGLLAMASFNRFNNNCYKDAVIVALTNCGTSVYAGFAVFSVIGFMSKNLNVDIEKVTTSGPGMVFVVYPEGLSMMPISSLWSSLFFFMVITLGLDSMFVMTETVITGIVDDFPAKLREKKVLFTLAVCTCGFILGLPMVTQAGIYWLTLLDWYSAGFSLFTVSLVEICVLMWVYGYKRFSYDIAAMIGHKPNVYFLANWVVITPLALIFILIFSMVTHTPASYDGIAFPSWAIALGWLMVVAALLWIPGIGAGVWMKSAFVGSVWEKFKHLMSPAEDWGPAMDEHKIQRESMDDIALSGRNVLPTTHKVGLDNPGQSNYM